MNYHNYRVTESGQFPYMSVGSGLEDIEVWKLGGEVMILCGSRNH